MRALGLAVGLLSVSVMAQTAPVLQGATADTIAVSPSVLHGLAVSEPNIVAPADAPQTGVVSLAVLVSKTGAVEEVAVSRGTGLVEEVAVLRGDQALRQAAVDGVMGWSYKPYLLNGEPREVQSWVILSFHDGVGKYAVASLGGPVRVSSGVVQGLMEHAVAPVYPPEARAAHVQGVVVMHAILSKTGDVENLQVISGPPMLTKAAVDAVKQWEYRPYLLNGVPTEVETTINVNFTLGGETTGATPPAATPDPK